MPNSREIRRRIKSVKNIGQITKALELVSASKMRKAQAQALSSRPYAKLSSSLLENLSKTVDSKRHPLLERVLPEDEKPSEKILSIIISPDKGLAGALNTNLINTASGLIRTEGREKIDFITIGKKGTDLVRRMNLSIIANFDAKDRDIRVFDAKPIAQIAIDEYLANHYSKVFIIYTDFVSTLNQKPRILQILPLTHSSELDTEEYLFEPNPDEVLEDLIYRTIEFAVYQSLVEAVASEHSARMVAMRNANEASSDLMDELQLSFNQARQSGITRELSEISAAKLAMEN
jgi:F-type H+-transporting ATPase subunit gamma